MNRLKFTKLTNHRVFQWLKHHPWLLVLPIGVIPLFGFLVISDARQSPPPPAAPIAPSAPSPLAAIPQPLQTVSAQQPTVTKSPQATASPKPQASPKASPEPAQAAPAAARPRPRAAKPKGAASVDALVELRVAVAQGANSLAIGTSTAGAVLDTNGKLLQSLPAMSAYTTETDGQVLDFGTWKTPAAVWIQPGEDGLVYVGDRWYRGRVLLVAQGTNLLAVNYVSLRDYLCSVVGGEMSPSWYMEALKAQAVAARSYALTFYFRPASDLYNLGNTEAYQVYGGVEKEANTTCLAVDSTSGEFLSYQGGIVESLYAASDDIVIQAHGGMGMSQTGAFNLAGQGYDYLHILGTYYPGTGLGQFVTQK